MDEQRNQRLSSAFTFLQQYHSEGEKLVDHIVTGEDLDFLQQYCNQKAIHDVET